MICSGYGSNCGPSCVVSCPIGENWESFEDQCYYWSKGEKTWYEAEDFCKRIGGHLASVPNEGIHSYLKEYTEGGTSGKWVGGISEPNNDTWVWTDCTSWDYNAGWGMNVPNDPQTERCLFHFYSKTLQSWNDDPCTNKRQFVCSTSVCAGKMKILGSSISISESLIHREKNTAQQLYPVFISIRMPPTATMPPSQDPLGKKSAPSDNEPLSNSNFLERLREFGEVA